MRTRAHLGLDAIHSFMEGSWMQDVSQILQTHHVFVVQFLNLFLGFSGVSEDAVGLGVFFYVEWTWNYGEIRSGGRVMMVLGFRKHFLSITNDFGRNYLISLR